MSDQFRAGVEAALTPEPTAEDLIERVAQEIFDNIAWHEIYRFGDTIPDTTPAARAVVAMLVAPDVSAVKARALREAAQAFPLVFCGTGKISQPVEQWLLHRAAAIERASEGG